MVAFLSTSEAIIALFIVRHQQHVVTWNGRDDAGRHVAGGKYWIRLDAPGETGAAAVHVRR
jgi:hypothetical protein